jgi:hypothetical protein
MGQTKKHHYLPRFYLRGFTNDQGNFYILDKKKEEIRKSKPENSFFEKYRNSAYLGNERIDLAEKMIAHFENRISKSIEIVRNSEFREDVLSPEILYDLRFFIALLFWRIPSNDDLREEVIDKHSFEALGLGIFNSSGQRNLEAEEMMKDIELFRKLFTPILPVLSFNGRFKRQNYNSWKIIHRTNPNHVTGDNPILYKNSFEDISSTQEELIAPISSQKILVCTERHLPKIYPPQFNLKMDVAILMQSKRYICSSNEEYLELLLNKYLPLTKEIKSNHELTEHLFDHFY